MAAYVALPYTSTPGATSATKDGDVEGDLAGNGMLRNPVKAE